ncbi:Inositol-pentakisphosphate 2-kinase [Stylophora pistillata]|uniref:Inositol-pentakisphosphate 2-kinase n=1 Tax=Stylophora pistillata TaxID=50429 RepID=A0A2B4RQT7_STYPI|nr:Inositol-pentakisphosphate 2-kinase [Stylophora pistillata]
MLPLMGKEYVRVGKVISVPEVFIASMNEICWGLRPDHRLQKEIDESCLWGVVMPDFCFLPAGGIPSLERGKETNHSTFSVELKPKCGFLPSSKYIDPSRVTKFTTCQYCMLQKSKVKEGKYKRESNYCPLDLFSRDRGRVMYAFECLVSNPQNNLRVFCDGVTIFTDEIVQGCIQEESVCCAEWCLETALQKANFLMDLTTADTLGVNSTKECHDLTNCVTTEIKDCVTTRIKDFVTTKGSKMEDSETKEKGQHTLTADEKEGENITTHVHECGNVGPSSRKFLEILLKIFIHDSSRSQPKPSNMINSPNTSMCRRSKFSESEFNIQSSPDHRLFGNGGVLQNLLSVQKLDDLDVEGIYPLYKRVLNYLQSNPGLRESLGVDGPFTVPLWQRVASSLHSNILDTISSEPSSTDLNSNLNDRQNLNDALLKICQFAVASTAKDCSVMVSFQRASKKEASLPAIEITCGDFYHYNIDLVDLDPKEFDRVLKYYNDSRKTVELFGLSDTCTVFYYR